MKVEAARCFQQGVDWWFMCPWCGSKHPAGTGSDRIPPWGDSVTVCGKELVLLPPRVPRNPFPIHSTPWLVYYHLSRLPGIWIRWGDILLGADRRREAASDIDGFFGFIVQNSSIRLHHAGSTWGNPRYELMLPSIVDSPLI